jgi:hypothetical protein
MRKRSKYRPKKQLDDPVSWVVSGLKPMNDVSYTLVLRTRNHDAMDKLRRGVATKEDIDTLIGAFNMTEGYKRLRPELGQDWSTEIRAGQDALLEVATRGLPSGKFILKASELVAMNLVMEIHDAQLDQTTVRDMEMAMDIIDKDHKNKNVGRIILIF